MTDFRILGWRLAKVMRKEKEQAFDFINPIVKLNIGFLSIASNSSHKQAEKRNILNRPLEGGCKRALNFEQLFFESIKLMLTLEQ